MDIKTKFGIAKDIKIEPYGDNTFTLAYISKTEYVPTKEQPYGSDSYELFGFDAPMESDPYWRFWVECGDFDGCAETYSAEISNDDKTFIRQMYIEYCNNKIK